MKTTLIKRIGLITLGVCLTGMAYAGEKEIFYDAKGNPAFIKDKTTGKITSAKHLVKETEYVEEPAKAEQPTQLQPVQQPVRQPIVRNHPEPEIPMVLIDKTIKIPRNKTQRLRYSNLHNYSWGYGGYTYPSYGGYYNNGCYHGVIPRFSRNGSYGPVRYYGRHNHYNNRGGLLLKYRYKNLELRARF